MAANKLIFIEYFLASNSINNSESVNKPDGFAIFFLVGIFIITFSYIIYHYIQSSKKKGNIVNLNKLLSIKLISNSSTAEFKMSIKNKSNEYIEINAPEVNLKGIFFTKKMKVKSTNYPLTISPGTTHSIIFKKKQLKQIGNSKVPIKLFRIFIFDKYNNVLKTKYQLL